MSEAEIETLKKQLNEKEKEATALMNEFDALSGNSSDPKYTRLNDLRTENEKLKYRVMHLEKAIREEMANSGDDDKVNADYMISFRDVLIEYFGNGIQKAFPSITGHEVLLTTSTKAAFGDYQMNSAMGLSKILKEQGVKANPREVATKILENIEKHSLIDKCEIAGPGFINVFLDKDFVAGRMHKLVMSDEASPPKKDQRKRVVIDYSSPNIAKEMHVGHLRSTVIGDAIGNLCEFLGYDVLRLNHVGDWGTQFGMLIAHLKDIYPSYKEESPNIADLQAFYRESKKRFEEEPDFKERAYDCVVKLQSHDPEHIQAWNLICDVSRKGFQEIYSRLDISQKLKERGESFYQSRMNDIVEYCEKQDALKLDEGRKILWPPGCEIPLTVVKSDGGYTYDTSDLAALKQRIMEEKADWIIYVVDSGQSVHFKGIFGAVEMLKITDPEKHRIDHVGFGVVLGEDKKKFKTRSGQTIRLADLLDEGVKRSLNVLIEKERDKELTPEELNAAKEAVAYGCIKYADLSHTRTNDYIFSFDKMLDDKGNTAAYLMYAYVRILSIIRKTGLTDQDLKTAGSVEGQIKLGHEKEWKLSKIILRFPEIILKIEKDLFLHSLCDYLYDLSGAFTEFYDACKCMEKDKATGKIASINMERILLCYATAKVMRKGFEILGLRPLERM